MNPKARYALATLLLSSVALVGCGNALVTSLQVGVDAAAVAVATATSLEAGGTISTDEANTVITDAQNASAAFSASITELNSTDTTAIKFSKVAASLSGLVLSTTGLSPKAAALVTAIDAAVTIILQDIAASKTAMLSTPEGLSFAAKPHKVTDKLSGKDKAKLSDADKKARDTYGAAATWKAKHGKK